MNHIVNFSGGDCSFWAAHRVIEKYGPKDVTLLFADTLVEASSLYALNAKTIEILGVPITRISRELTPWQLFRQQKMIGNARSPICSVKLKREPLDEWHRKHFLEMDSVLYIGFDWTETHRLEKLRQAKPSWRIEAPMQWEPFWDKCKMRIEAEKLGVPEQPLYAAGFPHNNCGGRCVAAGISHWVKLYWYDRAGYMEWEKEEQDTLEYFALIGVSSGNWTMLKDRRGGKAKPLSLKDLRIRIEAGEEFDKYDWGRCGCGTTMEIVNGAEASPRESLNVRHEQATS